MAEIRRFAYGEYYQIRSEKKRKEEERPWDQVTLANSYIRYITNPKVLDAGTGNARKAGLLQTDVTVGFDNNLSLLESSKASHVKLLQADILKTFPFPDETFDLVTFMIAKHSAQEAFRVLKPGGIAIMERVGEMDKREIKEEFGNNRGYMSEFNRGELLVKFKSDFEEAGFKVEVAIDGFWKTWVTKKELFRLIKKTPFVEGFPRRGDVKIFNNVAKKYRTEFGIEFTQHRILIVARK